MSDLFHGNVPFSYVDEVMQVVRACPQHTFQVLTKRAGRMLDYFAADRADRVPIPRNLWLGVTAENQKMANQRVMSLIAIPIGAPFRNGLPFVSVEPMLEPIDLKVCLPHLGWVIIGCESGPGRRPCELSWVQSLVDQCKASGVSVFVKQLEINGKVSKDPAEWPADLRIQEFPDV